MSEQLRQIAEHAGDGSDDPFDPGPPQIRLMAVREATVRLCWGTMQYRCADCSFEWAIWLALGVEGPPALRDAGLYLASPFMIGCVACGEAPTSMSHVDRQRDAEWDAPRLAPDDVPRFVLPRTVWRGDQGAELEIPDAALVKARRAA